MPSKLCIPPSVILVSLIDHLLFMKLYAFALYSIFLLLSSVEFEIIDLFSFTFFSEFISHSEPNTLCQYQSVATGGRCGI